MRGLVAHSRIRTTYARAKEASRFADKLVTIAKQGTLHARRELISKLNSQDTAKRLLENIAPLFKDQAGGYTRVLRYKWRPGDGAEVGLLEFTKVIEKPAEEAGKKKEKKKKAKPEAKAETAVEKPPKKKAVKKQAEAEKPEGEKASAKEGKVSGPSAERHGTPVKKDEGLPQEEPKKGGFLSNLRKFLKGE